MFVNDHNHPLSEKCVEKRQWKSHNFIDPMTKAFIRNLTENNVSLGKIYNILCGVNSEPGVAPYRKETLKYLCSRMSQESAKKDISDTIRLLQDMRAADGNLVVSINVDKEGSVKSILWCTSKNREDYAHFGDVVTFDTTYRTNLYNMPFGLFVGVNNHFQSTIFGGVLLRQETIVDFEWAFKTFVETMNGKHPQTMLTDQCKAMEAAIKNVLPHTRHRWCKWHIVKCAKEKLGFVYSKNSTSKHEFHSLINDVMDVTEFEKKWEMLIDKHNMSTNTYLGNMYANREKWAKPYFTGVFCAGMTSTQRSESANHMLKKYIPRSSPMHLFVKQYNNLLRSRITDEGKEDFVTKMKRRVIKGGNPIEADASQIYTNAVYQRFE
ncbi:protein FAR1-RELATED SEQUENCE 5-like [Triticum urartu]|uniref:protein FAR1-RELATED SEQUENCE 5-like n=1 Tax=Triticum urartu TaxID=4572 RepID=UPI002043AC5E|nr:protein FAR1-RELATED SEQUENCE 5-like [Triticum urartu]XP_048547155.1 protein FAR1-RELATED SEQUENCE 5-like [Triticum urartu]XP_048547156.1 protein FAR1-RELATED SEQUENCE 5-like [Triticum urartu]XP_048547157.1 protein FAR1-RELATED SEQUENCE 5-like [Triticum urartu]XP_048547158.1 protein FAR1-RELATED SEQUENCE 5-like [Triticum urartu]XP_048547159.1 protein FAR1-RELATED SEQUENCE 5-like [Triticum urartu]XP_048547160.1 protein FAR1-RELATED SEQUENCE 5-like [Triticum urartu]XP_048547161.1 protein FA